MENIVLVTGGLGYIGCHTAVRLLNAGYTPIIIDNNSRSPAKILSEKLKSIPTIQACYGDEVIISRLLCKDHELLDGLAPRISRICGVIHFAAYAYVAESFQHPSEYYLNNVNKYITFLGALSRFLPHVPIVFSSSCSVYGQTAHHLAASENQGFKPVSPYGRTKAICEMINGDFSAGYDMNIVSLRYFNACGAWIEEGLGELHDPETHVLPLLIKAAYTSKPFTLHGSDYNTHDGTVIRDFVHVRDLADAHVEALRYLESGVKQRPFCDAYNVGSGNGTSVLSLIKAVEKYTGRPINLVYGDRREGDPEKVVADISRISRDFCWTPKHSKLDNIVMDAIAWYNLNNPTDVRA